MAYILLGLVGVIAFDLTPDGVQTLSVLIYLVGYFVLLLVPAFKGNKWREDSLSRRGYGLLATLQAESPDAAVAQSVKLS